MFILRSNTSGSPFQNGSRGGRPSSDNRANDSDEYDYEKSGLDGDSDEDEHTSSSSQQHRKQNNQLFQVIELTKLNYSELVVNLPRGFRTILLVVSQDNRQQLIQLFSRVCCKYVK